MRGYASIANELPEAGYSAQRATAIKAQVQHYERVRQEVKLGAGENVDYKAYEADMRYLLDTYIRAGESEKVTTFDDQGLIELIVEKGTPAAINRLPAGIKNDPKAAAGAVRQPQP